MSIKNYINHFKSLIELEREEEKNRHLGEIMGMSPERRQAMGRALLGMNGKDQGRGLGGTYVIKYMRKSDLGDTEINTGNIAICSSGKPNGKEPQATVVKKTKFSISLAFNNRPPGYCYGKNLRIDLFVNDITFQRMLGALKQLKKKEKLSKLVTEELSFKSFEELKEIKSFNNVKLNKRQKEAVEASLNANDYFLIHGPPGTGKTTTLVESILQHVERGDKILVCTDSNVAVDHLLEKLGPSGIPLVRMGNPARLNKSIIEYSLDYQLEQLEAYQKASEIYQRIDELKKEQSTYSRPSGQNRRGLRNSQIHDLAEKGRNFRGIKADKIKDMSQWLHIQKEIDSNFEVARHLEEQATDKILSNAKVVCATNSTAGSEILAGLKVDCVFIDEATQAMEPACLIPMVKAERWIMAGDHHQLPPTVLNKKAKDELQQTLFERLIDSQSKRASLMLNIQYRMNEKIMEFSNKEFYNSGLHAHPSVKNHELRLKDEESQWDQYLSPNLPHLFIDVHDSQEEQSSGSHSYHNPNEAYYVVQLAEALMNKGLKAADIGIISPYYAQIKLLKEHLSEYDDLEIKTVDGFQGREKEVIILSIVRSNERDEIGFLSDYRRLNVALTRARKKLLVIGNKDFLEKSSLFSQYLKYPEVNKA